MKRVLFILLFITATGALFAQGTLPPYHWANSYIEYLKLRGHLAQIDLTARPFERLQVARALLDAEPTDPREAAIYQTLVKEFRPELERLAHHKKHKWAHVAQKVLQAVGISCRRTNQPWPLQLGATGWADYDKLSDRGGFSLRPQAVLTWGSRFYSYNNFEIFNRAEPEYSGKKFSGLYARNQQSFMKYSNDWLTVKIGRDWHQIGAGRTGQLLLSDNSEPFDQYLIRLSRSGLTFSFWGIQLDRRGVKNNSLRTYSNWADRFINGHRISYNWKNRLYLGASELILYGGPDTEWELGYLNPFNMYYAYNENVKGLPANLLYNLDWDAFWHDFEFYGEFLLDDYQIEKKDSLDLEPNELGILVGVNWTNPIRVSGLQLNAEYTQVRNRTYNAPDNDWEKYLHRDRVIGYYLGNNFEHYYLAAKYWFRGDLSMRLYASLINQGEGSVAGEFNKDYLHFTPEQGYREPFPFGVVEKSLALGLHLSYVPFSYGALDFAVERRAYSNYRHVTGQSHSEWNARVKLWFSWLPTIKSFNQ